MCNVIQIWKAQCHNLFFWDLYCIDTKTQKQGSLEAYILLSPSSAWLNIPETVSATITVQEKIKFHQRWKERLHNLATRLSNHAISIRGRTDKKLTSTLVIRTFLSFELPNIFLKYGSRLFFKKA